MASLARAAAAIAAILAREGLDYAQSKAVFKAARQPPARFRPGAAYPDPPARRPGRARHRPSRRDHQTRLPHLLRHTVAIRLLARGMDITDLQHFLGHASIVTTRHYAETTAAMLQRRFDQLTDPAAHALVAGIRRQRGDETALLAAELLAGRWAERVSLADP